MNRKSERDFSMLQPVIADSTRTTHTFTSLRENTAFTQWRLSKFGGKRTLAVSNSFLLGYILREHTNEKSEPVEVTGM